MIKRIFAAGALAALVVSPTYAQDEGNAAAEEAIAEGRREARNWAPSRLSRPTMGGQDPKGRTTTGPDVIRATFAASKTGEAANSAGDARRA